MSNDEVRWTRSNVGKREIDNNRYIHNLDYCDKCLVNLSKNREFAIDRWTTRRKKKRTKQITSTTAINSCHRTLFSATGNIFTSSNVKIITLCLILINSNTLWYAEAAVLDSVDFSKGGHYTHTWAVHIPDGDESGRADQVAKDHGFVNLGKIFNDHYHFAHTKVQKRSLDASHHHQSRLANDHRINWALQQKAKSRQKRDYQKRSSRMLSIRRTLMDEVNLIDPKWSSMWYLNRGGGLDMNVIPAWQQGITGKGVVVTILDDGLEYDHPDIEHNYDPKASYDVNNNDSDPSPQYDMTDSNRHGTRCAGEVAATANNTFCAVGIAYGAKVGGVRMLDGDVTDAVEARSLSLFPQHIDIYSASWGPDDDGKTVDGPGDLATRAFIEGVTKGRDGRGSIFIWASGNGGRELDNCNCDGYTNSIWTLSISSATEDGNVPWYSEKCSSTLATTYSSGAQNEKQVVTTDLHHTCTVSHTGTSASAPLAAGIAALVLEANRNLTWRDLQHIVVRTAKPANLQDSTWSKNGVGRNVSHSFGYGLMDAAAMVKLAKIWRTVPEQQKCEIHAPHVDTKIPPKSYITLQLTVKHCVSVNFLEHVQAKITLTSQRRGDLQINLISPAGTKVTLLTHRIHDASRSGFNQWPFMSVHTWGEAPHGNWQLEIYNDGRYMAQITQWDMIFFGTVMPAQPDDPVRISPLNDLSNNIDETSSQWRDMQDIQQSEHNAIRNAAACQEFANQRCIECISPSYLYKGKCFTKCPNQTYVPPNIFIAKEYIHYAFSRVRRQSTRICLSCDKNCLSCNGSNPNECTSCFPGSQLRTIPDEGTYCYSFSERSSGSNYKQGTIRNDGQILHEQNENSSATVFVLVIIPAVFILLGVTVLVVYRNFFFRNDSSSFSYRPVAFDSNPRENSEPFIIVDDEEDDDESECEESN